MAIQDLFFRDFWWKFLAFILATLIWANFGGKLNERIEFDAANVASMGAANQPGVMVLSRPLLRPITILRGANNLEPVRVEPVNVELVLRAEASIVRTINPKQILAFVDVTDMNEKQGWSASTRRVSRVVQVSLPDGVELVSIEPKSVIVERVGPNGAPTADLKTK